MVRGALPGLQVVAVSKLTKTDQRAIEMWQLAGGAAALAWESAIKSRWNG